MEPAAGSRIDLKETLGHLYAPSTEEVGLVEVPAMNFVMIEGAGEPNRSKDFSTAIKTLRYLAFALMFGLRERRPDLNYAVMPLETLFRQGEPDEASLEGQADWKWTAMIMLPEVITEAFIAETVVEVRRARRAKAIDRVRFAPYDEGRAVQILHHGPFTDDGRSVRRLHAFIEERGLAPAGPHHEIYLTDPQRVLPRRMRTILRQPVAG